jgi:outer membrane protein
MTILSLLFLAPTMTLDDAVAAAIRIDTRSRSANVQVEQSERLGKRAFAGTFGPRASATASESIQSEISFPVGPSGNFTVQPQTQFSVGGQLTVPLYVHEYWGRREQAQMSVEQNQATRARTREQVAMDTITAYYEVLKADRRVDLAHAQVERAQAQVDLAKARTSAGAALKTALLQAQIDLDRYQRVVADSQGQQQVARDVLSRLTGAPLDVGVAEPPAQQAGVASATDGLEAALKSRPDLRAAERAIASSQADLSATRARLYPTLAGVLTYTHYEPTSAFVGEWRGIVTLTVPLIQSGTEWLDISDKESSVSLATIQRDQVLLQIRNDVTRAWTLWETARRNAELSEHQLGFAKENQSLVTSQFRGGTATSTDVTVAQSSLAEAEINDVIARYDREIAAAGVRFQTGTLAIGADRAAATAR